MNKIKEFYSSVEWKKCRETYKKRVGGLCEECSKNGRISPADDVHHIIKLSESNIDNPEITLNYRNLVALCRTCHEKRHRRKVKRYFIDPYGRVKPNPEYEEQISNIIPPLDDI